MQRPSLTIELAGNSGVGKSTIAPMLAKELRASLGAARVAALPETGVPRFRRHWTRLKRRFWLAIHPSIAWSAWKSDAPREWFFLYSSLGLARRALYQGCVVAIVDQGILRTARTPEDINACQQSLLPDLVLHLVTDTATSTLRQLLRNKKMATCTRFHGAQRENQAREHRAKLEGLPSDLIQTALLSFSRKFCEPPLDLETIQTICIQGGDRNNAPQRPTTRCAPPVMEQLLRRGTAIETIDNSYPRSHEDCVQACLQAILRHLQISKA
jgi:hypothetical protein